MLGGVHGTSLLLEGIPKDEPIVAIDRLEIAISHVVGAPEGGTVGGVGDGDEDGKEDDGGEFHH